MALIVLNLQCNEELEEKARVDHLRKEGKEIGKWSVSPMIKSISPHLLLVLIIS